MEEDKVNYLIDHFLHIVPFEISAQLKYPYLREEEIQKEKNKIAEILISDYKDKIFFNNCPKCKKLARTPKAKQCRHCGHIWH